MFCLPGAFKHYFCLHYLRFSITIHFLKLRLRGIISVTVPLSLKLAIVQFSLLFVVFYASAGLTLILFHTPEWKQKPDETSCTSETSSKPTMQMTSNRPFYLMSCFTEPKELQDSGCNPMPIYLGVSSIEHSGTYFRVNMHRSSPPSGFTSKGC